VYPLVTRHFGADIRKVPMPGLRHDLGAMLDAVDEQTRLVFLASPNNPTPHAVKRNELLDFVAGLPEHVILCYDAAYVEYMEDPISLRDAIREGRSVIETRTFSKIYGLAGLRVGYGMAPQWIIDLLKRTRQPFSVNSIALAGALAALEDAVFLEQARRVNRDGALHLGEGLRGMGINYVAGEANFILVNVGDTALVCEQLLRRGVIVRSMQPFSLDGRVRVSIGSRKENDRFLEALADLGIRG
jgi:histidinol-phosphate aminotransferase